jgi:hypothetical protein
MGDLPGRWLWSAAAGIRIGVRDAATNDAERRMQRTLRQRDDWPRTAWRPLDVDQKINKPALTDPCDMNDVTAVE